MKKIGKRSVSVLLIAAFVLAGLGLFIFRYVEKGEDWARYFSVYNSESEGSVYDKNGLCLAYFNGAVSTFANDSLIREANYHVTGDYWDRSGTGILAKYWKDAQNYDLIQGTTEASESVLHLSIDARLAAKAYTLLKEQGKGCMMIVNYKTGEVLVMTSSPSIDPLDSETEPPDGAFINRNISASFVPGSTFKLITAATAIEQLPNLYERSFLCEEEYLIAGVPIICTTAHGTQNFEQALANSCNCAFAQITVKLGQDTMIEYVKKYGFLDTHTLNGITTAAGNYPLEFVGDPELGWSGIGQSTDLVCPYTLLRYVSAIANGGTLAEPTLIAAGEDYTLDLTGMMRSSTAKEMKRLMRNNVVTHYEGDVNFPGLKLCAKTGTAETGDGSSHSWFAGFLDDEEHPYAFVTLVENGGFGLWTAGILTNEILQQIVSE